MANSPISSKRAQHIDEKRHFIMDAVLQNKVYIVYFGAEDQHRDFLTERLNAKLLGEYTSALMNVD